MDGVLLTPLLLLLNAAGGCRLPVPGFSCVRAAWEGYVMLLPSTGPFRAGPGEKVKRREGALVLGCTNTFELLGVVGHILPMWLGCSFPGTASAQALPAAEWRQRVIQQRCLFQQATSPGVIAPELGGGGIKGGTVGCMPGIQGCPWHGHNVYGHGGRGPPWLVCCLERGIAFLSSWS